MALKTTRHQEYHGINGAGQNGNGHHTISEIFSRLHPLQHEPSNNGYAAKDNGLAFEIKSTIARKAAKAVDFRSRAAAGWQAGIGAVQKVLLDSWMERLFVKSPWVAGKMAPAAIARAIELNKHPKASSSAILCCLGEHIKSTEKAHEMMRQYHLLLLHIATRNVNASVAVRPSPFGSDVLDLHGMGREEYCWRNLDEIVALAKESKNTLVWLDMEDRGYTNYTLEVYNDFRRRYGNVGIVLQANITRSADDLLKILRDAEFEGKPPVIRLVRGIYKETGEGAIEERGKVHENFATLIRLAFENAPEGTTVAVATHQEKRILESLKLAEAHPKVKLELQMLKGIKADIAENLRNAGYAVTEYVPYGEKPFAYSMRRFGESPQFGAMVMGNMLAGWPPFVHPAVIGIAKAAYYVRFGQMLAMSEAGEEAGPRHELENFLAQKAESADAQAAR
jgi:proline dehydrogenase